MTNHYCKWKDQNTVALIYQEHEIATGVIVSRENGVVSGQIHSDSEEGEILGKVFIPREVPDVDWDWEG